MTDRRRAEGIDAPVGVGADYKFVRILLLIFMGDGNLDHSRGSCEKPCEPFLSTGNLNGQLWGHSLVWIDHGQKAGGEVPLSQLNNRGWVFGAIRVRDKSFLDRGKDGRIDRLCEHELRRMNR